MSSETLTPVPRSRRQISLLTLLIWSVLLGAMLLLSLRARESQFVISSEPAPDVLVIVSYGFPSTCYSQGRTQHADGTVVAAPPPFAAEVSQRWHPIGIASNLLLLLLTLPFIAFWVRQIFGQINKVGDAPL